MLTRPWVTPQDVRDWTERESVKNRSDQRLTVDIFRAENFVIAYTRNRFDDPERFPVLPEGVRIAVLLLADHFAHNATVAARPGAPDGRFKSEKFDDYSYTLADAGNLLDDLDLRGLLDDYIEEDAGHGNKFLRMRRL